MINRYAGLHCNNAEIEIKNSMITHSNIVRTIYQTKNASFTATNAFLHPQVLNAQSGSDVEYATNEKPLVFPKVEVHTAGSSIKLTNPVEDSVRVIGIYGNGGNSPALTAATAASFADLTFGYNSATSTVTLPAAAEDAPVNYLIKYDRTVKAGMKLMNNADTFADAIQLTLYCSIVDPCYGGLRAAYVYIPSFQASPDVTISLSADDQEIDFSGNLNVDYCSGEKVLYYIYFPDEEAVKTAVTTA